MEERFKRAWRTGNCPTIKKIYKVIENKSFLKPYDQYKYALPLSVTLIRLFIYALEGASATKCSDITEHARLAL